MPFIPDNLQNRTIKYLNKPKNFSIENISVISKSIKNISQNYTSETTETCRKVKKNKVLLFFTKKVRERTSYLRNCSKTKHRGWQTLSGIRTKYQRPKHHRDNQPYYHRDGLLQKKTSNRLITKKHRNFDVRIITNPRTTMSDLTVRPKSKSFLKIF